MGKTEILKIKVRELKSYIEKGYFQDMDDINVWEEKEIKIARQNKEKTLHQLELKAAEQTKVLRNKYPEGVADAQYNQIKAQLDEKVRAHRVSIENAFINTKIQIRETVYSKKTSTNKKLEDAKKELEKLNSELK